MTILRPSTRPTRVGLLLLGLIAAGPIATARAQADKPKADGKTGSEGLMRDALEAYNADDFPKAVALLERAAQLDPKDRKPLFILSVFTKIAADKSKADAEKLAYLKQSNAAFARLASRFAPLSPEEESFRDQAALDEARVLALDGKPQPALDALVKLVSGGFEDPEGALGELPELKAVRALPDYQARLTAALGVGLKAAFDATEPFPFSFDLKDVDGKPIRSNDLRGSVAIVDVWGTWCPPCRKEIPHFVDLVDKYGPRGLKVVGINCNEQGSTEEIRKTVKDFIADNKMNYPCVLNDDKTEEKIPGFEGYPTTLFLDRTGKVRLKLVGYTPMARLDAIVATLLAEPAAK